MRKNWSFQVYAEIVRDEADWAHVYAMLMHDLPRWFHQLPPAAQVEALQVRPELTGTHWDALLAALVEHVARLHDHPAPAWVHERGRFLDPPWVICETPIAAMDSMLYAPAAFIRHGAFPDPLDLDERGGEKHAWIP